MEHRNIVNVAAAQIDIKIFNKEYNICKMESMAAQAREKYNSDIVVFPEASVAGYSFNSLEEVISVSERLDGPTVRRMSKLAVDLGMHIMFGMSELADDTVYNSSIYCMPDGKINVYRKVHLSFLGLDSLVTGGNSLPVFDTEFGKIGMIVCFDMRFPEAMREEALQGARLVLHSTNLPPAGMAYSQFINRTRACENRVFVVSANRTGDERGYHFIGHSQIIDINGTVLQELGEEEGIIAAEINLDLADQKDVIINPGIHELHLFSARRPDIYHYISNTAIK